MSEWVSVCVHTYGDMHDCLRSCVCWLLFSIQFFLLLPLTRQANSLAIIVHYLYSALLFGLLYINNPQVEDGIPGRAKWLIDFSSPIFLFPVPSRFIHPAATGRLWLHKMLLTFHFAMGRSVDRIKWGEKCWILIDAVHVQLKWGWIIWESRWGYFSALHGLFK